MSTSLRYLLALVPWIILFIVFYSMNLGSANLLLRDFGRVSFLYLALAMIITPIISIAKNNAWAPFRRVFGVFAFLLAIAHGAVYFYTEYVYQKTFFVPAHFLEFDVASWTVAFLIITLLGSTSNNFSVRILKGVWKKIQTLAYPLFLITALHIAFASRFDTYYMGIIGVVIILRTLAFFRQDQSIKDQVKPSNTIVTKYLCVPCWYIYDQKIGDPDSGIAPGTRFEDIPENWVCPVCGVSKKDFVPLSEDMSKTEAISAPVRKITMLNSTTMELVLETSVPFTVVPWQYARVVLSDGDGTFVRSYSIVNADNSKLTFCIKISTGRWGNALKKLQVWDTLKIENVYGSFVLQPTHSKKIFIATGTGIAPIINMMSHIPDIEKFLLFWVQDFESLFYTDVLKTIPNLKMVTYLSRETIEWFQTGRIDVSKYDFPKDSEFYICGNPKMVEASIQELKSKGFEHIYCEKF